MSHDMETKRWWRPDHNPDIDFLARRLSFRRPFVFLALFFERLSLPLFGCKCRGHVAFNGASHKFVRLHDWRIVSCLLYLRPMSRMLV
jgi:hypothetical protein